MKRSVLLLIVGLCLLCFNVYSSALLTLEDGRLLVFEENSLVQILPPRNEASISGRSYIVDKESFRFLITNEAISYGEYGSSDSEREIEETMKMLDTGGYYFTEDKMIATFPDDPEEFDYYFDDSNVLWISSAAGYYAWGVFTDNYSTVFLFEDGVPMILHEVNDKTPE